MLDIRSMNIKTDTVKPVLSGHSIRRSKIGFQDQLSLNEGQKYCRMLQGEHSAILSTFIKLLFVIKTFVLSIFEWPLKTGFTVPTKFVFAEHSGSASRASVRLRIKGSLCCVLQQNIVSAALYRFNLQRQ